MEARELQETESRKVGTPTRSVPRRGVDACAGKRVQRSCPRDEAGPQSALLQDALLCWQTYPFGCPERSVKRVTRSTAPHVLKCSASSPAVVEKSTPPTKTERSSRSRAAFCASAFEATADAASAEAAAAFAPRLLFCSSNSAIIRCIAAMSSSPPASAPLAPPAAEPSPTSPSAASAAAPVSASCSYSPAPSPP